MSIYPTTKICTWNNVFPYSISPEADVYDVLDAFVDDYDVKAIVGEYIHEINKGLFGTGIMLITDYFTGPIDHPEDIRETIKETVESIDLMAIAERYDNTIE